MRDGEWSERMDGDFAGIGKGGGFVGKIGKGEEEEEEGGEGGGVFW